MSIEEVEKQIRESAPLSDRLTDCKDRIGKMCAEGRPPKMSIPAQWNDDDLFICTTLSDAETVERERDSADERARMLNFQKEKLEAALSAAQGEVERMREVIEIMIQFIPDGWEMPLGWNQVVAKAQEAFGGKHERS